MLSWVVGVVYRDNILGENIGIVMRYPFLVTLRLKLLGGVLEALFAFCPVWVEALFHGVRSSEYGLVLHTRGSQDPHYLVSH